MLEDDFIKKKKESILAATFAILATTGLIILVLDLFQLGWVFKTQVQALATAFIFAITLDFYLRRNITQAALIFAFFTLVFLTTRYITYRAYLAPSVLWFIAFPPIISWIANKKIGLASLIASFMAMTSCWLYFYIQLQLRPVNSDIIFIFSAFIISSYLTYIVTQTQSLYAHHLEEKVNFQRKELHQSQLASLGELAGNIAHEINNPLQVMKGNATQLKKKILKLQEETFDQEESIERIHKIHHHANNIDRTVDRTKKIIDSLLKLSRQPEQEVTLEETSLSDVWNQAYPLLEHSVRQSKASISFFNMEKKFKARPELMAQILINLIKNSLFEIENSDNPWIRIEYRDGHIDIVDSGKPFDDDFKEKALKPFYTTKGNQGTGLGLPLCVALMRQMGGDFDIPAGQTHATFRLILPESD